VPAGGCTSQALEVLPRVISPRPHRSLQSPLLMTPEQLGRHQKIHILELESPDSMSRIRTHASPKVKTKLPIVLHSLVNWRVGKDSHGAMPREPRLQTAPRRSAL